MSNLSSDERERLEKINEMFYYNVGYNHVDNVCDETYKLLEEYRDIEIPESLNSWFLNYNKKLKLKEQHKNIRKKLMNYSKKIAVVLLAVMITFSVLTVTVEAFRVNLFNMIISIKDRYSEIKFEEGNGDIINQDLKGYYPSYVPSEYEISEIDEDDIIKIIEYKKQDEYLYFSQDDLKSGYQIDTENAEISNVNINGYKATLSIKPRTSVIIWNNGEYIFCISGQLEKEEIIKMAESVKFHK